MYKSQKLLSINLDAQLPTWVHNEDTLLDVENDYVWSEKVSLPSNDYDIVSLSRVVFIIVALVILVLAFRYFKFRTKPRKKRSTKLKRLLAALSRTHTVPSV